MSEIDLDIKTSKTALVKGICKTLGFEAQLGTYVLLRREHNKPSTPKPPLPSGWMEQKIRASYMWNWADCPARAAAETNQGKRRPANSRMHLGTVIHKATALYDEVRIGDGKPSVEYAVECAVETLWKPEEEVDWQDETPRQLEPIARECTKKYCRYSSANLTFTGVEQKLADLAIDIPDQEVRIVLTGTQDRLRRTKEGPATDAHGRTYAEVIGIKTTKTPEIAVGRIVEPEKVLLGDDEHGGYLQHLAYMVRTGNFIGNPRSMFCNKRNCAIFPCFYARGGM